MKKFIFPLAAAALMLASCGKNINPSKKIKTAMDSFSYAAGWQAGTALKKRGLEESNVDYSAFVKGMQDALTKDSGYAVKEEAMSAVDYSYSMKVQEKRVKKLQEESKKFLDANAKKAGVSLLPSRSQYKLITPGKGAIPQAWDTISMHFEIKNLKGQTLINSRQRSPEPQIAPLAGLGLPPLEEAFQKSPAGSVFEIYIPGDMFPGQPNSFDDKYGVYIFKVEFLSVIPGKPGSEKKPAMPEMPQPGPGQ